MTTLKLSLGDQFVWALVQPTARAFIKETDESGYQATQLILSQSQPGPVEVVYENLPGWDTRCLGGTPYPSWPCE